MSVVPTPQPGAPRRRVSKRFHTANHTQDRLECGHIVLDYDNREPKHRLCEECRRWADQEPWEGPGR